MTKKDTKHFVRETAFKLFLDKGYSNTSMSDLVLATKLSKGAFYHHFKNKEELYQEVLNHYFLSYYQELDWDSIRKMGVAEIEAEIQGFYKSFIPEILAVSEKGMSCYFILFFEAFNKYPLFREEIRKFYRTMKVVLIDRLEIENVQDATLQATNILAKYEGLIFWLSVFPESKIEDLSNGRQ